MPQTEYRYMMATIITTLLGVDIALSLAGRQPFILQMLPGLSLAMVPFFIGTILLVYCFIAWKLLTSMEELSTGPAAMTLQWTWFWLKVKAYERECGPYIPPPPLSDIYGK